MTDNKKLATYFNGWPKQNNHYVQDLVWAMKVGIHYLNGLKSKPSQKPRCVVFDFDDCLVFGDPALAAGEGRGVKEMDLGYHEIDGEMH